jgi:hypothetical protein
MMATTMLITSETRKAEEPAIAPTRACKRKMRFEQGKLTWPPDKEKTAES